MQYRVDLLRYGWALQSFEIEAADDAEAVRLAQAYAAGRDVDLWQGERHVSTIVARRSDSR